MKEELIKLERKDLGFTTVGRNSYEGRKREQIAQRLKDHLAKAQGAYSEC
jgi:hypothetical protein